MTAAIGFAVVALLQGGAWVRGGPRWRALLVAAAALTLGVTALTVAVGSGGEEVVLTAALAVVAAASGGPLLAAVLTLVPAPPTPPSGQPEPLRGGATIGVLERTAVCTTLLLGWPEGLAVALAVKGLARYPELRSAIGSSERFIVGTFASVLWAAACAGTALLATR